MKGYRKQLGFFWIPAAISAVAAIAAQRSAARQSRLAQQNANDQAQQNEDTQREFAQNSIRWRVADAKAAGVHPLFALSGGSAGYQPSPISVMHDNSQATAISNFGNIASQLAREYINRPAEREGMVIPGQISDPYDHYVYRADMYGPGENPYPSGIVTGKSLGVEPQPPYGLASSQSKPSMAYWAIPGIGRVIAPDASNFSESIEGLESPIGQGLILYLNRHLGKVALDFLSQQMPGKLSFEQRVDRITNSRAWSDPMGAAYEAVGNWLNQFRR